jgi:hypothetical protein
MIYEIDINFYCSSAGAVDCPEKGNCIASGCSDCHRKHPTPEQFKQEYGYEYPDRGAAYYLYNIGDGDFWRVDDLFYARLYSRKCDKPVVICACTPFPIANPRDEWRPE